MSDEEYEYEYNDDESMGDNEEGSENYTYSDEENAGNDDDNDEEENDDEESFDYTDEEDEPDDIDVALENAYYNAKQLRDSGDVDDAAGAFEDVVKMETEALSSSGNNDDSDYDDEDMKDKDAGGKSPIYGPWSYKAIKQLVKLHLKSGDGTKMMEQYERMLKVVGSGNAVSPNAVEKGVNGMLERVSSLYQGSSVATTTTSGGTNSSSSTDPQVWARNVYDSTLRVFHPKTGSSPNERLWFKTNLKYGQLLYEMNETSKLQLVIRDLLRSSGEKGGSADGAGGEGSDEGRSSGGGGASTHLMEISALQIQLYSRQKDTKKLREVFQRAMRVQGGIPHPRTLALIQELGGKMHMTNREFDSASKTFFQAFKSYDEAGDPARLRCLKYLVMASMLHASKINPFDSQEARPYKDDSEIKAMTNLVAAFHNNEITEFEGILQRNEGKIMDDEFVREHVSDLLRTIRTQVLRKVIGPYTRISLEAIARELNGIPVSDVESLLVSLILDGKLDGRIDQAGGILYKRAEKGGGAATDDGTSGGGGEGGTSSATTSAAGAASGVSASSGNAPMSVSGKGGGSRGKGEIGFGEDDDGAWGYSGSVEARNCASLESLTLALEHLTASVTSAGGKGTYHQIM
mmetsp:Transcript_38230/g.57216  ORF Transcript_38230/g.57216 Transcript_38230/m.57216 type:complete len:632 (-) Transcript_38230:142-2037(-)